jgi:hypothetical protein
MIKHFKKSTAIKTLRFLIIITIHYFSYILLFVLLKIRERGTVSWSVHAQKLESSVAMALPWTCDVPRDADLMDGPPRECS